MGVATGFGCKEVYRFPHTTYPYSSCICYFLFILLNVYIASNDIVKRFIQIWCAGMLVVPMKKGAIHICVDLKQLNENVLKEVHPLPIVDETLAQLAGAKISSKLDVNSGFWQIPLAKRS